MPLHDWTDRYGWEGLHHYWMSEIGRQLRADLPPGFRAIIGSHPYLSLKELAVKPDIGVTNGTGHHPPPPVSALEPDVEVAVATMEEEATLQVEWNGRMVAAIELISPRNKDRPAAREHYANRYLSYLRGGVHLLLVDVHRRPVGFSFAQLIAAGLGEELPAAPTPSVVSYRVGTAAAFGGRMLGVWQQPLAVAEPLPRMPLALTPDAAVMVELEPTYSRAAADSYVT